MKKIKLTKNKVALVDDVDFDLLNKYNWWYHKSGYALRIENKKTIRMHRVIANCPENKEIDHINGNRMDNRKINLRICTSSQNSKNRKLQKNNKSGYKGVSYRKRDKKWIVYICVNRKNKYIGIFKNIKDASNAYNIAAVQYYKEFANLNK